MLARTLLLVSLAGLAAGCATEQESQRKGLWTAPPEGVKGTTSGLPIEPYFPMKDGEVYQYETINEVGDRGLLVARVHRADSARGELRFPQGTKVFEYRTDGIYLVSREAYVLKMPLQVGNSWRGENGGSVKITSTTASVETPAGRFDGCVQTLEERGGDRPVRYGTTFCPGMGVVLLEAASGANFERASLKARGEPVNLGPDGLTRSGSPARDADPKVPAPAPSPSPPP